MSSTKNLLKSLLNDINEITRAKETYPIQQIITTIRNKNEINPNFDYAKLYENQSIQKLQKLLKSYKKEIELFGIILGQFLIMKDELRNERIRFYKIVGNYYKQFAQSEEMKFGPSSSMSASSDLASQAMGASNTNNSDFIQWLHAMKMVARLPGGMPPEFRKKLWLALAEQYLQTRDIDWEKEQTKCLCDKWRDDDEELGIQIVKDLHRTGSSLFSGPAGSLNQAKLKRVLLGYARWNPEVGYCQGFNMLGALILQVMDKNDIESLKVMIFLVEGILPPGYFCGSLGGLQADMAVFRELLGGRLPRLAKHLQKLQGPLGESSFEPPLTNVFTMQWFLTLFCTCLPINCVLRVWDLVLIEGSDILLRTALAIWGLLEERILATKSADDFYCKMGTLSGELLNGHLFDSNGLIQKVVELGPISELQKMRDKHLYNITPWRDKRGLRLFFSDDDGDSDEDSKIAVTTAWGIRLGRRGSSGLSSNNAAAPRPIPETKDRMALDISLLKKQYDKLRERQRQAHIILTNSARQSVNASNSSTLPVNQYLMGRNAIVSNKGRRIGPPPGAIPPVRKAIVASKLTKTPPKQIKKSETLYWKDTESPTSSKRKNTITWKEHTGKDLKSDGPIDDDTVVLPRSPSATSTVSSVSDTSGHTSSRKRSGSSSYSEDSDGNSSTSTSLCDDENLDYSSFEASPLRKPIGIPSAVAVSVAEVEDCKTISTISSSVHLEECIDTLKKLSTFTDSDPDKDADDDNDNGNNNPDSNIQKNAKENEENLDSEIKDNLNDRKEFLIMEGCCLDILETKTEKQNENQQIDEEDSTTECDRFELNTTMQPPSDYILMANIDEEENIENTLNLETRIEDNIEDQKIVLSSKITFTPSIPIISPINEATNFIDTNLFYPLAITSTSQLSPIADISKYLSTSTISPLRTPSSYLDYSEFTTVSSSSFEDGKTSKSLTNFKVDDEGVTNEYFEHVNIPERPCRLDLHEPISEHFNLTPKQRPTYDDDISKRKLYRSPQVVDLNIGEMSPITSIIPPCTDITKIPPEKSPLIHRTTVEFDNESHVPTPKTVNAKDDPMGNLLTERIHFLKEKSFSLDEPQKSKQEFRPTSCPEVRTDDISLKKNDRVLKIIEENSMILHRILRKNFSLSDVDSRQVKPDFMASLSSAKEETQEEAQEEAPKELQKKVREEMQEEIREEILEERRQEIDKKIQGESLEKEMIKIQKNVESHLESISLKPDKRITESLNQNTTEETKPDAKESAAATNEITDNTFEFLDRFKITLSDDEDSSEYLKITKNQSDNISIKPMEYLESNTFQKSDLSNAQNNDLKSDLKSDWKIVLKSDLIKDLKSDLATDLESDVKIGLTKDFKSESKSDLKNDSKIYLTRDLKNDLKLDSNCDFTEDLKSDFSRDLKGNFENDSKNDSKIDLTRDLKNDLKLDSNCDFTEDLKSGFTRNLKGNFENDSKNDSKIDLARDLKNDLKLDSNCDFTEDLKSGFTRDLKGNLENDLKNDSRIDLTRDLKNDLKLDSNCDFTEDLKSGFTRELKGNLENYSKNDLAGDVKICVTRDFKNELPIDLKSDLMSELKNSTRSDSKNDFVADFKYDIIRDLQSDLMSDLKSTFQKDTNHKEPGESEKSEIDPKIACLIENITDNKTILDHKLIDDPKLEISVDLKSENNLNLIYQLKKDIDPLLAEENLEKEDPQKDDYISDIKNWLPSAKDYQFADKTINDNLEKKYEEKLLIINDETSKMSCTTKIDDANEPANDISITLSSIKNTIKSIDSLCQDDEESFKKFRRKTLTDSPKKDAIRFDRYMGLTTTTTTTITTTTTAASYYQSLKNDQKSQLTLQITPSFCIEEIPISSGNTNILTPTSYSRHSRDYHREASPRRRRDDEREEYESRAKRDLSPNVMSKSDVLPHKTSMDFKTLDRSISNCTFDVDTKDYDGDNRKDKPTTNYGASSKYPDSIWTESLHDQQKSSISDKYVYPEKFEIRHTTVTSTFYDRYLSQKKERCSKLDKSPSSPIITKAYLDTLKPPTVIDRNSKSAENSPSRMRLETELPNISMAHSLTLLSPTDTICSGMSLNRQSYVKSCDNIPARIPINVPTNDGDFRRRID